VHISLLPDGRLLYWGRDKTGERWDIEHRCNTYTWHPVTKATMTVANLTTNLFCSGHSFLPDGRLFVSGGGALRQLGTSHAYDMYPFMHLAPDGKIFIPGPELNEFRKVSRFYDPNVPDGADPFSESASFGPEAHLNGASVMYDAVQGKVLMVVGKTSFQGQTINTARVINLSDSSPTWRNVQPMNVRRKFHTATLLPDGKVLVTGGTPCSGANNINCSEAPHTQKPEMWDPSRDSDPWVFMAANPVTTPRVYHSVALLLPDARALVGGGGLPAAGGEIA
jgi:hypothetical protein